MRYNKFKGFFSVTNLGAYDHSEEVSGRVFVEEEVISCVFSFAFFKCLKNINLLQKTTALQGFCKAVVFIHYNSAYQLLLGCG